MLVTGYEPLIDVLELPDADDRHVLAAAIKVEVQAIVTNNLKVFPAGRLHAWDVEASNAVSCTPWSTWTPRSCSPGCRRSPTPQQVPMDVDQLLTALGNEGLVTTVVALRS